MGLFNYNLDIQMAWKLQWSLSSMLQLISNPAKVRVRREPHTHPHSLTQRDLNRPDPGNS